MRAGRHVLVEKPAALSVAELEEMSAAAEAAASPATGLASRHKKQQAALIADALGHSAPQDQ